MQECGRGAGPVASRELVCPSAQRGEKWRPLPRGLLCQAHGTQWPWVARSGWGPRPRLIRESGNIQEKGSWSSSDGFARSLSPDGWPSLHSSVLEGLSLSGMGSGHRGTENCPLQVWQLVEGPGLALLAVMHAGPAENREGAACARGTCTRSGWLPRDIVTHCAVCCHSCGLR